MCFAVVTKELQVDVTNDNSDMPLEVKGFSVEFDEIVSKDLPKGLPPMRSINHHIDLVLEVSLPNKVAYRLTPTKNEEVNKQV